MKDKGHPLDAMPFVRMLPAIVAGVLLGWYLDVSLWVPCAGLAVCYLCAWFTLGRRIGWVYISMSLAFTGWTLTALHAPQDAIPTGQRVLLHLRVTDNPATSGRWQRTTAWVEAWRDTAWHKARQRITLSVDTCHKVAIGHEMVCAAWLNRPDSSGYANLMRVRGFRGHAFVTRDGVVAVNPYDARSPRIAAARMQRGATGRIARLGMPDDEFALVSAMTTGERRIMSPALKQAYSRVGASHLLSVSGIHMAIVFVLVNALLWLLPLLRRGHIVKNVIAVAAIWIYAAMTGLSAPAMRAAMMFTGAQVALAASLHRGMLNVMAATAAVLLLLDPSQLFDVSFQLSIIAVLSIMLCYKPVFDLVRTRRRWMDAFVGTFTVGVVATVGTAPLVAYYFSNFPLVGLLVNPPVILTSNILVLLSLGWIVAPLDLLQQAAGWAIGHVAKLQNDIVWGAASLPGAAAEVHLSAAGVGLVYLLYAVVFVALSLRGRKRPENPFA